MDDFSILSGPALQVASRLLGSLLVRKLDGRHLVGRIVETEAYDQADAASHSYKGRTSRTNVMFGPAGHLYVYFTYGMHYCMNIVCGPKEHGAAVLIRAVEPIEGEDRMILNRGDRMGVAVTNGPAKVCQALAIDKRWNGHDLHREPLQLLVKPTLKQTEIAQTARIGIAKAKDTPWRFYIRDNPYVSK